MSRSKFPSGALSSIRNLMQYDTSIVGMAENRGRECACACVCVKNVSHNPPTMASYLVIFGRKINIPIPLTEGRVIEERHFD